MAAPATPGGDGARPLVKSAERTVLVLESLAAAGGFLSLSELHRRTGYPRSSLFELLRTLAALRWVETTPDGLRYAVGPHVLLTGTSYLDRDPAVPHAVAALEQLRAELGCTAHYARLDGGTVLYLVSREIAEPRRVPSRVGRQLPAHATALGQALLADRTAAERDALLPAGPLPALTGRTLTTRDALEERLAEVSGRGFAVERGENTEGVCCVAAVVGHRIPATDAVSCSLPRDRATPEEVARIGAVLRGRCDDLAAALRRDGVR